MIIDDISLSKLKSFTDIRDFINFIGPYYPDISIRNYTIVEIEQALFHVFIKIVGRIISFSPHSMQNFLRDYLLRFEITNIKQIILCLITSRSAKEKRKRINFLVEDYLNHGEFISEMINITSLDEIQLFMANTMYNKAIREGILYFKNNGEIFVLESFLDRLYYDNLIEKKNSYDKVSKEMINVFISYLCEIYNLRVISRGIVNNIDRKLLKQFLVKEFLFLNQSELHRLLKITNINVFYSEIENLLKKIKELKELKVKIKIVKQHLIWSLGAIYQNYYFSLFKNRIDNIPYSTVYRILEIIIKKDKEIKFNLMPNIIRIIHDKYERLDNTDESF